LIATRRSHQKSQALARKSPRVAALSPCGVERHDQTTQLTTRPTWVVQNSIKLNKQLRLANKLANENLEAAEINQDASMDWCSWGGWGGMGGMGWR
jgi:hypothetical protein